MSKSALEPKRVAVYSRVATEAQAQDALETQKKILRTYAERLGEKIVAEVSDVGSGTSLYRPGIQELLRLAERHEVDMVLAVDPSRVARSTPMLIDLIGEFGMNDVTLAFAKQPDIKKILDSISSKDMEEYFKAKLENNHAE